MDDSRAATGTESTEAAKTATHDAPQTPQALIEFMSQGWADRRVEATESPSAPWCAKRRARVSERFAGEWIVVPTGTWKVRANDTMYRFRPSSDFAWLTGNHEPDGVLV